VDTIFEKIKKIEIIKEDTDCFDIEVSGTHNFFADDVLVHNCKICNINNKEPCKHPDESFCSPEGCGIDLYNMLPEMEIPPVKNFHVISMVYGSLNFDFNSQILSPRKQNHFPLTNISNLKKTFSVKDIWDPDYANSRCNNCKLYSPLLCDRSRYQEQDLYNHIKDWHLYSINLKHKVNTVKAIKELHNHQLQLHRQGYWESFVLLPGRCPACQVCNIDVHKNGGYKVVQNRAIPLCLSYFNLKPDDIGENVGYILV